MTIGQIIAYYTGVLISSGIIFFILRAIFIIALEKKRKKIFLITNPDATSQEIDIDFEQYFQKRKTKFYAILVIVVILIYIILHK